GNWINIGTKTGGGQNGIENLKMEYGNETKKHTTQGIRWSSPTQYWAVDGLYMGERTGSRTFQRLWSYVSRSVNSEVFMANPILEIKYDSHVFARLGCSL